MGAPLGTVVVRPGLGLAIVVISFPVALITSPGDRSDGGEINALAREARSSNRFLIKRPWRR